MRNPPLRILVAGASVVLVALAAVALGPLGHTLRPRLEAGPVRGPESEPRGEPESEGEGRDDGRLTPADWFWQQRAFPNRGIPEAALATALERAQFDRAVAAPKPQATTTAALTWQNAGPFNIGGRVTALAVAPGGSTLYLGAANGGVFKSTNSGVNWTPVFDSWAVYSIGALAMQPGDPNTVYAGTGEANASVDSYDGAGLFRTTDGGTTWQFLGLEATRRIARIAIDPANTNRIFVAAMGPQFSATPDRGLYLSEDAGATWNRVLALNDSTGICDVVVNPAHSDTVFAASWERIRKPTYRRAYGAGCGIWRSIDSGHTWLRLQNGLPAPSDSVGRIALAIPAARPSWVYAQIIAGANLGYRGLGLYRTQNGGATWSRRDTGTSFTSTFSTFGWYFGDCAADPVDPNKVTILGVTIRRSTNGGQSFSSITGGAHVDEHALWIDPANTSHLYMGSDGGFFSSLNAGASWTKSVDLPITQFYAGAVDPSNPARLMGGTQDNNTILTPGAANAWSAILGGDGFHCLFDPLDPQVLFAEYQNASGGAGLMKSMDGGLGFSAPAGFSSLDRYNWSTPAVMSPQDHNVLLVGSQRVYKSTDNGDTYNAVSGDLTSNPISLLVYGTITTLDISPVNANLYYAGTDDGRVWRSTDAGSNWLSIWAGLPVRWVTRITADPVDGNVVYLTLSGFGIDEHVPRVYRSTNRGDTWIPIDSNLPDAPANDILADPADNYTLYLATDVGVYASRNRGQSWFPLGTGMPVQTIFDLTLHAPSRTLVAATHGRGQWKLDVSQLPTDVAVNPQPAAPQMLRLGLPVPNPSRGAATLVFEAPAGTRWAQVAVYDARGRHVRTLLDGAAAPGARRINWDGRDGAGRRVAAGAYFVRARAGGAERIQRLIRID